MYLLYGLMRGDKEQYKEVLLCTTCKSLEDVDKVVSLAKKDGFHSFRVVKDVLAMPDFIGSIKGIRKRKHRRR